MKHSFLQPDLSQIRHQIRQILVSYSHEWDIVSELVQNAVDAIKVTDEGCGHISLVVDASTRTIEIADDGIGIDPTEIYSLLRPFGTRAC